MILRQEIRGRKAPFLSDRKGGHGPLFFFYSQRIRSEVRTASSTIPSIFS